MGRAELSGMLLVVERRGSDVQCQACCQGHLRSLAQCQPRITYKVDNEKLDGAWSCTVLSIMDMTDSSPHMTTT